MARSSRASLLIPLTLLALFLTGTVIVLSTVSYYLAIEDTAYLTEVEVPPTAQRTSANNSLELIPRIIHQTWKTDDLPERWKAVSQTCRTLMPDYEFKLWTDKTSRDFIAEQYPWFLSTFDGYQYNIQRADAIRYFVLHHYGGVYLDLDVGCQRPLDPLLEYSVVLPKTIPVGVSNDLMFSAKEHPFMTQTIHNLITFDHNYFLNYPTVMFSTGPMYVSAQYGIYTAAHPHREDVRILSKPLYGKNARPDEAPHSFFSHHYGSSWHSDDAAFITFLGKWGKILMKLGLVVLVVGLARMFWARRRAARGAASSSRGGSGFRRRLPGVGMFVPRALVGLDSSAGSLGRHHHSSRRAHMSSNRRRQHSRSMSGENVDMPNLQRSTFYRSSASAHVRGGTSSSSDEGGASSSIPSSPTTSSSPSPISSHPNSPSSELPGLNQLSLPLLPLPFDLQRRPSSESLLSRAASPLPTLESSSLSNAVGSIFRRAGGIIALPVSYFRSSSSKDSSSPGRRDRSDSTRAHVQGRAPPPLDLLTVANNEADRDRSFRSSGRRHSHSHSHSAAGTNPPRRSTGTRRHHGVVNDRESFVGLIPAIFASSSGAGPSSGSSSDEDVMGSRSQRRMLTAAAEAKAKEAGFTLALPSTLPRHLNGSSTPSANNNNINGFLHPSSAPQKRFDLLTGSATTSASSSRAGTPLPTAPAASAFFASNPAASSSVSSFSSMDDDTTLDHQLPHHHSLSSTSTTAVESSSSSASVSYSSSSAPSSDADEDSDDANTLRRHQLVIVKPPSPLLIDPLEGSDVRTTRSFSVANTVLGGGSAGEAPPPYRASGLGSRTHSSAGLGQGSD